jgi:hypothetical protein
MNKKRMLNREDHKDVRRTRRDFLTAGAYVLPENYNGFYEPQRYNAADAARKGVYKKYK